MEPTQQDQPSPVQNGNGQSQNQRACGIIYKGRFLQIYHSIEQDGTDSYALWGQLPVFNGVPPKDLEGLLVPGQVPDVWGQTFKTIEQAQYKLERIEANYPKPATGQLLETILTEPELRAAEDLALGLRKSEADHPDYIGDAKRLFLQFNANQLVSMGCQEFIRIMARDLGPTVRDRRATTWRWAINVVCAEYGIPTGNFDRVGERVKEMPLGAITRPRLLTLKEKLPRATARALFPILRYDLDYAVKQKYLRENPAEDIEIPELRSEKDARIEKEIVVDYPAQVQIAFNLADQHRNGYFLPHVTCMYQPHVRPDGELKGLKPGNFFLYEKLLRVASSKVGDKRLVHLSVPTCLVLTKRWDGKRLQFDGFGRFLAMMRAAQGYGVSSMVPKWFAQQLPPTWAFALWQIIDLRSFADKLLAKANPVYEFLMEKMGDEVKSPLEQFCSAGGNARDLQTMLVDLLNKKCVDGPSLMELPAFQDIELTAEIVELQKRNPTGDELRRLNRMVLPQACRELAGIPRMAEDIPRHTGRSGYAKFEKWVRLTYDTENNRRVFKTHYDAVLTPRQTVALYPILPEGFPVTDEERGRMMEELAKFELLEERRLPEPPIVPKFVADKPEKEYWVPKVADELIERMMFQQGMKATAKELGTSEYWLRAICRAKGLRTPPGGNFTSLNPDDFPKPEALVTIPNADLEKLIKENHGIAATARALDMNPEALMAYCIINNIRTPTLREIASWLKTLPRINESPRQIKALLERGESLEEVAKKAGKDVTVEHLRKYCCEHGIAIANRSCALPSVVDVTVVKAAVDRALAGRNASDLKTEEIIELVLRHAPGGLTDSEIIQILEPRQIRMTRPMIQRVLGVTGQGHIQRYNGRVYFVAEDPVLDMDKLKQSVLQEIQRQKQWNKLQAILFVLNEAKTGISIHQLSIVLSWFGIAIAIEPLKHQLRQYQKRGLLEFYEGVVTLPENVRPCVIRPDETEATPNLAEITANVQNDYAELANKEFTNVEMMEFVLSRAPQGLWADEFLGITKSLGLDFKQHCIHSVVTHEAPGRFKRKSGRLTLEKPALGCPPRVAFRDLEAAIERTEIDADEENSELALDILIDFQQGLHLRELHAALGLAGRHPKYESFCRNMHVYAKRKRCQIRDTRVTLTTPLLSQNPLPAQSAKEPLAA